MTEGTYDPGDRVYDPEQLQKILEIIMNHMVDAMRLACVEKGRIRCHLCVMALAGNDVEKFFAKYSPATMESMGVNDYMAKVVQFARKETFKLLASHECREVKTEGLSFVPGNATCH